MPGGLSSRRAARRFHFRLRIMKISPDSHQALSVCVLAVTVVAALTAIVSSAFGHPVPDQLWSIAGGSLFTYLGLKTNPAS